jgi:undecaprenyl-diphosphatase
VEIDAGFNGPRLSSKYHAFPSGHTSSSTAFFGVLLFANVRIAALLAALPLLIAFSRLYVGAHHLSDVVAGLLVGMAVAALVARWPKFEIADRQARIED